MLWGISLVLAIVKVELEVKILSFFKKTRRPHKALFRDYLYFNKFRWGLWSVLMASVYFYLK